MDRRILCGLTMVGVVIISIGGSSCKAIAREASERAATSAAKEAVSVVRAERHVARNSQAVLSAEAGIAAHRGAPVANAGTMVDDEAVDAVMEDVSRRQTNAAVSSADLPASHGTTPRRAAGTGNAASFEPSRARGAVPAGQAPVEPINAQVERASVRLELRGAAQANDRSKETKHLLAQADLAASQGQLSRAAVAYERALSLDPSLANRSTDGIARMAIMDLARDRTQDIAGLLQTVIAMENELSPVVRQGLLQAVRQHTSPLVSKYVARALDGNPLSGRDGVKLAWYRSELTTMRDIELKAPLDPEQWTPDLSEYTLFVDDKFRVGHEGLLHHLLENPGAWRKHPELRVQGFGLSGELPGVVHDKTRNIYARPMVKGAAAIGGIAFVISLDDGARPRSASDGR